MLTQIGLEKENLRFTIPGSSRFASALEQCGVKQSAIFTIDKNGEFWQEWRFGEDGLIGKGLTAIYARDNASVISVADMEHMSQSFIEIGNLIYIYGKADGNTIVPIPHPGFEVGIGIERLALIQHETTLYEIPSFRGLISVVDEQVRLLGGNVVNVGTLRVLTDHLRSIDVLIQEGLKPGNKLHAFVLRKLIRSVFEIVWTSLGRTVSLNGLVQVFAELDMPHAVELIVKVFSEEQTLFLGVLTRGKKVLAKNPSTGLSILKDTYGLREGLISLVRLT